MQIEQQEIFRLSFKVGERVRFYGKITNETMEGTVEGESDTRPGWYMVRMDRKYGGALWLIKWDTLTAL